MSSQELILFKRLERLERQVETLEQWIDRRERENATAHHNLNRRIASLSPLSLR